MPDKEGLDQGWGGGESFFCCNLFDFNKSQFILNSNQIYLNFLKSSNTFLSFAQKSNHLGYLL